MPLCRGNHWAGVVRVTSITQFRARQFISPYTVYKLPSPALAQVCRYCRYCRYCSIDMWIIPVDGAGGGAEDDPDVVTLHLALLVVVVLHAQHHLDVDI